MNLDTNHAMTDLMDPDDRDNNTSGNPHLNDVLALRMHRRHVLKGGVGAMTMAGLGTLGLTACGGGSDSPAATPGPVLNFSAVAIATTDRVTVPAGYTATVIYALGDSIDATVSDYKNDGTDGNFARRSGDHHDGIHFFGLTATGTPSNTSNDRALLVMNHENISGTVQFMHATGQTNATGTSPRPESEVIKEIEAHGVSVVEIAKTNGKFAYVKGSTFNRRITASTPMELTGPVRGTDFVKTLYSPTGTQTRGTVNNCGNGYTPWGTYLTAEENWAGYFLRGADTDVRTAKDNAALLRNGITAPVPPLPLLAQASPTKNGHLSYPPIRPAPITAAGPSLLTQPKQRTALATSATLPTPLATSWKSIRTTQRRFRPSALRWAVVPTKAPGLAWRLWAALWLSTWVAIHAASTSTNSCRKNFG